MKKTLMVVSVIALLLVAALGVSAQDAPGTIADLVVASTSGSPAEFTILLAAVQAADPAVLATLSDPSAALTVFAPTDAAFTAAFEAMGVTAADVLANPAALTDILKYHVVPGIYRSTDLVALDGALLGTSLNETALVLFNDGTTVRVNNAAVLTADIEASNGVVHAIDGVLLPPVAEPADTMGTAEPMNAVSIAETVIAAAGANPAEFTILLAAVQAADPAIVELLTSGGPYTVFAPTDAAFAAAIEALGTTPEELLANTDLLNMVLAYHVIPGHFTAETVMAVANVSGGIRVATLLPGTAVTITATDMGVTVDSANVITTDVHASNGIVHVIDAVLLPPMEGM